MNAVDELISQLRTKSGWWSGDDNARRLLEPLVQARDELARVSPLLSSRHEDTDRQVTRPEATVIP